MKEIVAAKIGTFITNNPKRIRAAVENGVTVRLLGRQHMKFMAAMDLGDCWKRLATSPTLFRVDDRGELHPPELGTTRR